MKNSQFLERSNRMQLKDIQDLCENVFEAVFNKKLQGDLFGQDGEISSIELIRYLAEIEDTLEDYEIEISILSDKAFSYQHSPFRTIPDLANYIKDLL